MALHRGLSFSVYEKLAKVAGIEKKILSQFTVIAPATLARRARSGHFTTDESDRIYRFVELLQASTELFEGDKKAASIWMQKPILGLGGRSPASMIATSAEMGAVMDLIGRMEHGVFS